MLGRHRQVIVLARGRSLIRTTFTAFVIATAILVPHSARAHQAKSLVPAYGCEGAPGDAILVLPAPAGYWMRIVCTDNAHTLAPIPGDAWQIVQDSRPLTISAAPGEGAMQGRHSSYFVAAVDERLSKANAAAAQARFSERAGFELPQAISATYAVYLTSNGDERDAVYVFLDKSGPVAGLACRATCEKTVAAMVIHPEVELPSQQMAAAVRSRFAPK